MIKQIGGIAWVTEYIAEVSEGVPSGLEGIRNSSLITRTGKDRGVQPFKVLSTLLQTK